MITIDEAMDQLPLVAILRGVQPDEVVEIGRALYEEGFRCIEVPLNSPDPLTSIRLLAEAMPEDCICGAGTVLSVDDVHAVQQAGGRIIVTPNTDADVIRATVAAGLIAAPGVGSATEAFVAVAAGATHLKLFPASTYGIAHMKALQSVLPKGTKVFAVGGVGAANIGEWQAAGAGGFGIGSELYKAGDSVDTVRAKAQALCRAIGA